MLPKTQPGVQDISPYVPGTARIDTSDTNPPLKLSSNEGALGPSPKSIQALQNLHTLHRYPDGQALEVRAALAKRYDVPLAQIVCGAGSDELISLLVQAYAGPGDEVLYSQYGFLMYHISALAHGATPVAAPETNLRADVDALLKAVTDRTRLVFLANPNNPTGSYLSGKDISRLHACLPEHCLLVIDGAYAEYVTEPDYDDCLVRSCKSQNLVVTRTFSKLYALGGLRLGWMVGPAGVIDAINRVRGPFNVSSAAIAAGAAAVKDLDFQQRSAALNHQQMARIVNALGRLGIKAHPSVGNFVLADFGNADRANQADLYLQTKGIIVRSVASYGLPHCLRMTLGTDEDMSRVIDALSSFAPGAS